MPYVDNDYKETAKMARRKLVQLKEQYMSCNNMYPSGIERGSLSENCYSFGEYYIESEMDKKALANYIKLINHITETSIYPGKMYLPEEVTIPSHGTLEIREDADSVKFYVNPALQLKRKLGRKRNIQIQTGNYSEDMENKKLDAKSAPFKKVDMSLPNNDSNNSDENNE